LQQAQQIFKGSLDPDTKLQLAVVALQALDWRCKHLTQRLRGCLEAMAINVPNASPSSEQLSLRSSPSYGPLNMPNEAVMARRMQGKDLSPPFSVDRSNSGFTPMIYFCP
jgi:hypothetical protein